MKRIVGMAVSALIIVLIWRHVDLGKITAALRAGDPLWLAAGLFMVVPLTLATAWRFRVLSRSTLGIGQACRLILSSSTLNLFLPSKMGDLAKAVVLTRRYGFDSKHALAVVVLEKLLDLASLLACGVLALLWAGRDNAWMLAAAAGIGLLLALLAVLIMPVAFASRMIALIGSVAPGKAGRAARDFSDIWTDVIGWFWADRGRAWGVVAMSLILWFGHLAQFWLFARSLNTDVPFIDNMAYATLSILVGLTPFTMAGIGTRDAAIIFFYRAWLTPGQGAVLGVLATSRYLIPAIAGVPFLRDYLPEKTKPAE